MSYTETSYYKFQKPTRGDDWGNWGKRLNDNWEKLDEELYKMARKTIDAHIPLLAADVDILGQHTKIGDGISLSAVPVVLKLGASRLLFEVISGSGTIELAGNSMSQNTLTVLPSTEDVPVESGKIFITNRTWTEEVSIVCSSGCVANIYVYSGFSLDKIVKLNKIILKGKCNQANNKLDVTVKVFDISGKEVTITANNTMNISKDFSTGIYYFWHKELSFVKELIKNQTELVVGLHTDFPGTWENIFMSLCWE